MIETEGAGHAQTSTDAIPSNQTVFDANKDQRSKFLRALRTRAYSKNKIISFKDAGRVLSWYRIDKEEMHELLYDLQQGGYLKIVPYHGIILEEGV